LAASLANGTCNVISVRRVRASGGRRSTVDGHGGPTVAVLAAEVDQQGVLIVLDAHAMIGIALLVQAADRP
jgi:hypothetical protein